MLHSCISSRGPSQPTTNPSPSAMHSRIRRWSPPPQDSVQEDQGCHFDQRPWTERKQAFHQPESEENMQVASFITWTTGINQSSLCYNLVPTLINKLGRRCDNSIQLEKGWTNPLWVCLPFPSNIWYTKSMGKTPTSRSTLNAVMLPGQGVFVWHSETRVLSPGHISPPNCGAGESQSRCSSRRPLPHVTEQGALTSHSDHPPWTTMNKKMNQATQTNPLHKQIHYTFSIHWHNMIDSNHDSEEQQIAMNSGRSQVSTDQVFSSTTNVVLLLYNNENIHPCH